MLTGRCFVVVDVAIINMMIIVVVVHFYFILWRAYELPSWVHKTAKSKSTVKLQSNFREVRKKKQPTKIKRQQHIDIALHVNEINDKRRGEKKTRKKKHTHCNFFLFYFCNVKQKKKKIQFNFIVLDDILIGWMLKFCQQIVHHTNLQNEM